jgi:mRNA interferase RelE/StbE
MYEILYVKAVEKELRKLDTSIRKAIVKKILSLAQTPRPQGVTKLRGSGNLYRIRHTEYRVVYEIRDNELIVLVVKVAHRREVYRDF